MKRLFLLLAINMFILASFAQNVEFTSENFPNDKSGLKEAINNIKSGNSWFKDDDAISYVSALNFYLEANKFNPNNAELNYKIAKCYYEIGDANNAAKYGAKAYDLNPNINNEVIFFKALNCQYNMEVVQAIDLYEQFYDKPGTTAEEKIETKKHIAECERCKNMMQYEFNCFIDNMGSKVNTEFDEYGPVITLNDSTLYFTSRREGKKIKIAGDGKYYENVYVSHIGPDGEFNLPTRVVKLCDKKHVAVQAIAKDGKHIVVYKPKKGGDLYEATMTKNSFGKPKSMGNNINTRAHETSASYSLTGDTLYFCSEKNGGQGKHDVYMTVRDGKKWGKAVNMGTTINTEGDEIAVYAHPDGTLYICSDGHETMGGIDIFIAKQENGQWSKPQNIGYPINTPNDDVYFVVTQDGKFAYYSSAKTEGLGGQDLYKITLLGPQKQFVLYLDNTLIRNIDILEQAQAKAMEVEKDKITIVKGVVLDADTKQPVYATIELSDIDENELLATFTSDSVNGKYMLSLPAGKNYAVAVKAEGYLFHSENFDIPDTADQQTIEQTIYLDKIAVNKTIVLKNIFFDNAKATLRPASMVEIENVYKLLTENPTLCIEISGHTDNVGSSAYNKKLSNNRAKAVVDALVKKGIDKTRLTYKGYGFDKPIATNKTPEGRQLNRRTEFKVTKM